MTLQLPNVFLQLFFKRASADVDKMSLFLPLQLFHCVILAAAAPERSLWRWTPTLMKCSKKVSSCWDNNDPKLCTWATEDVQNHGWIPSILNIGNKKSWGFHQGFYLLHRCLQRQRRCQRTFICLCQPNERSENQQGWDERRVRKVQLKYVCLWKCACLSSHLIH